MTPVPEAPDRKYRLRADESLSGGVSRTARGRLERALEQLDSAVRGEYVRGIHEARKDLKKVRALLRLVRSEIGEEAFARENARYRAAARVLGPLRDSQVRLNTLDGLVKRSDGRLPAALVASLRSALLAEISDGGRPSPGGGRERDALAHAEGHIREGQRTLPSWAPPTIGADVLLTGIERSYRKGRARMKSARAGDPSSEELHEWRKRVRDLWHQVALIEDAWPGVLGPLADQIHELSDRLGDYHDLVVLVEDFERRESLSTSPDAGLAFLGLIDARQAELLQEAVGLGELVYAEKPGAFRRRIGRYLAAWRRDD